MTFTGCIFERQWQVEDFMIKFEKQSECQRFLLRIVPKDYWWWVSGKVKSLAELEHLHAQFAEFYGCDLSPAKKSYRKLKGLANSNFIAAPLPREICEDGYIWFLIATDGKGPIREHSKLRDARKKSGRIIWDDYIMFEAPRHRLEGGGTRWSWYLLPQVQKELDYHVGQMLKTNPDSLKWFFEAQFRRPMHHGVRHYLARLIKRAYQNFVRMHPGKSWTARDPAIPLPIFSKFQSTCIDEIVSADLVK